MMLCGMAGRNNNCILYKTIWGRNPLKGSLVLWADYETAFTFLSGLITSHEFTKTLDSFSLTKQAKRHKKKGLLKKVEVCNLCVLIHVSSHIRNCLTITSQYLEAVMLNAMVFIAFASVILSS